MLKNILIYLIIFLLIVIILFENKPHTGNKIKQITNFYDQKEEFNEVKFNENNFEITDNSIIMSSNTHLTKDECLNKVNYKDINGASYNLKKNICNLYFFATKGKKNKNFESKI